jgi:hypothetical protein
MTMTPTMTLLPPMNLMIAPEDFFCLCRERTWSVLSLYVSSGFIRGGPVTHNLSSLPGLAS